MIKLCLIGYKKKCHVVIWGGFPKKGEQVFCPPSHLCAAWNWDEMCGGLAAVLDHKDKGSRDGGPKNRKMPVNDAELS